MLLINTVLHVLYQIPFAAKMRVMTKYEKENLLHNCAAGFGHDYGDNVFLLNTNLYIFIRGQVPLWLKYSSYF